MQLQRYIPMIVLSMLCLALLSMKWQDLGLPHYWDEAFPYSYAIGHMVEEGIGIRSNVAPAIYTTGHPLLYYALQASWNVLVGDHLFLQRLLPLFLSMGCLWMTFLLGRVLFRESVGIGAALLLFAQNVFLAQSSFQLPEVLLTLLLLTTLYAYIQKRKGWTILSGSLMLFTKEPAIALLGMLGVYHFAIGLRDQSLWLRLRNSWHFAIPVLVNLLFYLDQYAIQGWFLFPRHTGFVTLTADFFFNQLSRYFSYLFLYFGRNAVFFVALAALIWMLYDQRKKWRNPNTDRALLLFFVLAGYLLFSAVNFYSNRYILCLFPLLTILASAAIHFATSIRKWIHPALVTVLSFICLYFSMSNRKSSDHSMGYADAIRTQVAAVEVLKSEAATEDRVAAAFLMTKNLSSHYPRYVAPEQVFVNLTTDVNSADWAIFSNNEKYFKPEDLSGFELLQRFEINKAWCEVYKKKP